MISFKSFVNAIQEAIISASDALMDKNVSLLDKYFTEGPKDQQNSDGSTIAPINTLVPKSVILEYPHLQSDGSIENLEVSVPLITLVPLTMSQVDKATLTAHFKMQVNDGELQLDFANTSQNGFFRRKPKAAWGKIEISFTPQETTEGLKLLVEGYEAILKRQIS